MIKAYFVRVERNASPAPKPHAERGTGSKMELKELRGAKGAPSWFGQVFLVERTASTRNFLLQSLKFSRTGRSASTRATICSRSERTYPFLPTLSSWQR